MVSANIRGPGQRWVQRIKNNEVHDFIFDVTHDVLVAIMNKSDTASAVGLGVPVTFYLDIDATKVEHFLEVSASHKAIIGDSFPNHVFDISNLPKDEVNTVISVTSALVKTNKATEFEVPVMSFHSTPAGVQPSVIVDAQPQGTNNMRNFVQNLNAAVIEAGYNKSSYTNFCVE